MFIATQQADQENNNEHQWIDKRERFDAMSLARDFGETEFIPDVITIDGHEISGSWTLVPGYRADKRLLYMHGGAFTVGSDISHRPLTVQLARRTGMAVFAPNYRLMPEHSRRDGIKDAQAAYDWILENGPDGPVNEAQYGNGSYVAPHDEAYFETAKTDYVARFAASLCHEPL